ARVRCTAGFQSPLCPLWVIFVGGDQSGRRRMSALPRKRTNSGRLGYVPNLHIAGPSSRASVAMASRPGPAPEQLPAPIVVVGCTAAAVGGGAKMENAVKSFEPSIDHFIRIIGSGIEIFGVLVIVIGIVWSTYRQLRQPISE